MMICGVNEHCPLCSDNCEYFIEVEPVRHGHWVDECSCSNCHWIHENSEGYALLTNYKYCPNCGAEMDGEDEKDCD